MNNIAITTECVADLPKELLEKNDIDIIYFDIETESGMFRDTDEVDANNIMEYMIDGKKKAQSVVPNANNFKNFFKKKLDDYDEVIHFCIGSGISITTENATLARAKMGIDGRRIHIVDTHSLSAGQAMITLEACKCRDEGMTSKEILEHIYKYLARIETTFLANNADYLYYNGKVGKSVMDICRFFHMHPVLTMTTSGLALKNVYIGSYEHASNRYIKDTLRKKNKIDARLGYFVYAGCGHAMVEEVLEKIREELPFEEIIINTASATVSCNCGPMTYGIMFAEKEEA